MCNCACVCVLCVRACTAQKNRCHHCLFGIVNSDNNGQRADQFLKKEQQTNKINCQYEGDDDTTSLCRLRLDVFHVCDDQCL